MPRTYPSVWNLSWDCQFLSARRDHLFQFFTFPIELIIIFHVFDLRGSERPVGTWMWVLNAPLCSAANEKDWFPRDVEQVSTECKRSGSASGSRVLSHIIQYPNSWRQQKKKENKKGTVFPWRGSNFIFSNGEYPTTLCASAERVIFFKKTK